MELRELQQMRNKSQSVTNILDKDFDFMWDGIDYTIEKGATLNYPLYLAEHCALHMARTYAYEHNPKIDYNKEAGKIVDKIMGKESVEYDKLTLAQAKELAEERNKGAGKTIVPLADEDGKEFKKAELIKKLKETH